MENHNQNKLAKQSQELKASNNAKSDLKEIVQALGACVLVQRTYGKQASDIDRIALIFAKVLSEYESSEIVQAIKQWLLISPDFPTPSDIKQILSKKKKLDSSIYNQAKSIAADTEGKFSSSFDREEARKYCRYYEKETIGQSMT